MPDSEDAERAAIIRELLNGAIPVAPGGASHFVTREEFDATIRTMEAKIESAVDRIKFWGAGCVIAAMLSFGGGFLTLYNKLDRLGENMPVAMQKLDDRGVWMQRTDRRNEDQDAVLRKLDPSYEPAPYQDTPR